MFVQFNVSPALKPKTKVTLPNGAEEPEVPVLLLAPFTSNPTLTFEDVPLGTTVIRKLLIENNSIHDMEVTVIRCPPPERLVRVSWTMETIPSRSQRLFEVMWSPISEGAFRDVITFDNGKRLKKDVPIIFKAVATKTTKKAKKSQSRFSTAKTKSTKSPRRKTVQKPLSTINNILPTTIVEHETFVIDKNKENISPNVFTTPSPSTFTKSIARVGRDTYTIAPTQTKLAVQFEETFDDSLDETTPVKNSTFISGLQIAHFPPFNPLECSANSICKRSTMDLSTASISTSRTFARGSLSTATYVKSTDQFYLTDRDDMLEENAVLDANLLRAIAENSPCGRKRKSDSTFNISPPKRPLLGTSQRLTDAHHPLTWSTRSTRTLPRTPLAPKSHPNTHNLFMPDFTSSAQACALEERFKAWLNVLLAPPDELHADACAKIDVLKLWHECRRTEAVGGAAAPSKEAVCNVYHTSKKLETLLRSAATLYRSAAIVRVLTHVDALIESKKLMIRADKDVHLDLGLQSHVLDLLLSYNPLWLRIGLETVYGTCVRMSSNSDVLALTAFIMQQFFKNPQLVKRHKTVLSPKYAVDIKQFLLRRFLHLVYFLDAAKCGKLISYDPCLFRKNATVKESRELLLSFARELLCAVGDVTKALKPTGYVVAHKQLYIHEFNYGVTSLGADLRDGVRLSRVLELMLLRDDLIANVRVPAVSRLQKLHNVEAVFKALQVAHFEFVGDIAPRDLVDGHREKTLTFLWQLIYNFNAPYLIEAAKAVQKWWRSLAIVVVRNARRRRRAAVAKIEEWYASILLGRRLEAYAQQYQLICSVVKIQAWFRMWRLRSDFLALKSACVKVQRYYRARALMRKQLHGYNRMRCAAIVIQTHCRGWICRRTWLRLMDATITIQRRVRSVRVMREVRAHYLQLRAAAIVIQRRLRAVHRMEVERMRYWSLKLFTVYVQRKFRGKQLMRVARDDFNRLRVAAICVQRRFKALKLMRIEREHYLTLNKYAVYVQDRFRAKKLMEIERKQYDKLRESTIVVQQRFRARQLMRIEQEYYLTLRKCTLCIQERFRAKKLMEIERNQYVKLRESTIVVQQRYRAWKAGKIAREYYLMLLKYTVCVQRRYRAKRVMNIQREYFIILKKSAVVVQQQFRARQSMKAEREYYLQLQKYTLYVQQRFRAKKLMESQRGQYDNLKKSSIVIQQRFRAWKLKKTDQEYYTKLRKSTLFIQRQFRAKKAMNIQRKQFINLKNSAVVVQQQFRARQSMKGEREYYLKLQKYTLFVQQSFRANRLMEIQRNQYEKLRKSTLVIQHRFRAWKLMKNERNSYLKLYKFTVYLQQRFRAKKAMNIQRKQFIDLKKSAVVVQQQFRARQLMKTEREYYLQLQKYTLFVQQSLRAKRLMEIQRNQYEKLRKSTLVIQHRFRAWKLMKNERNSYLKLYKFTVYLQQRFRAKQAMKIQHKQFINLKKSAIVLQQQFRARQLMKTEREYYLKLQKYIVYAQDRFRAKKLMESQRNQYENLKKSAIVIQQRFRAWKLMKTHHEYYTNLRKSTLFIQRQFRAKKAMNIQRKQFINMKKSAVVLQQQFKARQSMKAERDYYLQLQKYTLYVQQSFRAKILMESQRGQYENQKKSAIVIQQRFRASKLMKTEREYYLKLQKYTKYIQERVRAKKSMQIQRKHYQTMRTSTIVLQQRFRAWKLMKIQRNAYHELRICTIVIQRKFRATLLRNQVQRKYQILRNGCRLVQKQYRSAVIIQRWYKATRERNNYLRLRNATVAIQRAFRMRLSRIKSKEHVRNTIENLVANVRGFRLRKEIQEQLNKAHCGTLQEFNQKKMAATKIQALWKGHKVRRESNSKIAAIRTNLERETLNVAKTSTLACRRDQAIQLIVDEKTTFFQLIHALKDLEFVTRRCRETCLQLGKLLPEQLYLMITSFGRSLPEIEATTTATDILINLAKCPTTRAFVWHAQYIDKLLTVMHHWCDKDELVFPHLCTLLWLFAHDCAQRSFIQALPNLRQRIAKMHSLCLRKQKMVLKMRLKNQSVFYASEVVRAPTLEPDWGLDYPDKPRTFINSVQALTSLTSMLESD